MSSTIAPTTDDADNNPDANEQADTDMAPRRPFQYLQLISVYHTMEWDAFPTAWEYTKAFLRIRRELHRRFGRPMWGYEDTVIYVGNVDRHDAWKAAMWERIEAGRAPTTLEWVIVDLIRECGEEIPRRGRRIMAEARYYG